MGNLKILIVEDELLIADQIADSLRDFGYVVPEPAISFSEAVERIGEEKPDLALLDIQLSGRKSGIDLASYINEHQRFPFIFLTSNSDPETLDKAKRVEPDAFLVKPYSEAELVSSIEVAIHNFQQRRSRSAERARFLIQDALFIKQSKIYVRLNFQDILFLESEHVYLDIHLVDGKKYTVRGSLNDYLSKLDDGFLRTHRSFIVNLRHLQGINHAYVILNGKEVPLGRSYREALLERLPKG